MKQVKLNNKVQKMLNSIYCRVSKNIRFDLMQNTTLIVAGIGAFGHAVERFTRLAVGKVYPFDNGEVKGKNIVAQNFINEDIGLQKPEALKPRLESCAFEKDNPDIPPLEVKLYGDFLSLSDEEFKKIIRNEQDKGRQAILVMASDYHPVQARGNRIALKFEVPTFWVGIYGMGKAGEIIFFLPGYDLPCYRCITETRYRFFDKNRLLNHINGNFQGTGRSTGLPMAADYIDAILNHLIIGAIHIEVDDNQHAKLFRKLLKEGRNFIQCQLDPDYKLNDEEDIFSQIRGPDLITFNTIFQQENKMLDCIDCRSSSLGYQVWNNTDYTKENYREIIRKYCAIEATLNDGVPYHHPLIKEYEDLFPIWEKLSNRSA
jgi:hypothetical protein